MRMLLTTLLLTTMVLTLVAGPVSSQQSSPALWHQDVDDVFSAYDRTSGPGCAVGVVQDSRLAYARGYGIGQLDHLIPITESSVFYLASVSKQFTAAAIVIAEHEGHLSFDDEVREHLPEFPDYGHPVTIRNLLHHTSGVRDYLTLMNLAGIPYEDLLSDEDMLGLITRQKELNFEPGSEFLYSNSGYVMLAEIIERSTGRSLADYADEKIFRPLGMSSTHFHDDRTHVVRDRVFSYDPGPEGSWRTNYLMNFDKVGDGGLYSSIEDLAQWDGAFYEDLLGVPDFAARMYTRGNLNSGDTIAYARGLGIGERRGQKRVSHGGGLMAFRTMIARYPELHTSVITLCNIGTANSGRLSTAVEDVVLGDRLSPPSEESRTAPEAESTEDTFVSVPVATLTKLAGSYVSAELESTWVLEVADSSLVLHHPSGLVATLKARTESLFEAPPGLEFEFLYQAGEVSGFRVGAGRVRNILFTRSSVMGR